MRLMILSLRKNFLNVMQARTCCGRPPRCDAHMNELPIPCETWQPWYDNKQRLYNKILAAGILWFLFSFGMMLWTESMFLNWGPPKEPGPPTEICDECDCNDGSIFDFIIDYVTSFY